MLLDLFTFRESVHGIKYQGKHIHLFFQEQESNYIWIAQEITCWTDYFSTFLLKALYLTIKIQYSLILSLKLTRWLKYRFLYNTWGCYLLRKYFKIKLRCSKTLLPKRQFPLSTLAPTLHCFGNCLAPQWARSTH